MSNRNPGSGNRRIVLIWSLTALVLTGCTQASMQTEQIRFDDIKSPIIFKGDATTAYRDPAVIYHDGIFRLFYTYIKTDSDGKRYWVVAYSKSKDLVHWTNPKPITPKDQNLNFASPGNIIRYGDEWIICMQTYPTPKGEKFGNRNCRVWIKRSKDLKNWSEPEMLMVKGPDVPVEKMGRLIDAYLVQDKDEPTKWWCLFDDNAANMSYSYDLKNWTYFNRIESGENVCVLVDGDEYLMFYSPKNGVGMKRSKDMKNWRDVGELITLGQKDWPWAQGRLSAGFVLDMRKDPRIGKYLMFFHGSGPEDERTMFSTFASLALAWSDDLVNWDWPGKKSKASSNSMTKDIKVETPFKTITISEPLFAEKVFDIRDYGAVADGVTKNTKAFADAIDACNKAGGGRVIVPEGNWFTGPIHLKSHVNLHLNDGAVILFSDDFNDYLPAVFSRYEGIECYLYSPPIYAKDCENVAITGRGRLDGHGQKWWDFFRKKGNEMTRLQQKAYKDVPVEQRVFDSLDDFLRPSFVQFLNCKNVLIQGITIGSGPMWTLHLIYSEDIIVRDVTFITRGPNNDGIDPDSCTDVLIENCKFDTSDDAIAIKSGRDEDGWRVSKPCENIVIRNCLFGLGKKCDGVVSIGSEMSGDVRNVYIHNCHFDKTDRGIRLKSRRGRRGIVENIWIQDITMTAARNDALLLNTFYSSGAKPTSQAPPLFRNVYVKNLTCNNTEEAVRIKGLPEQAIENVVLENIDIKSKTGLQCSDAKGIKLINVNIAPEKGPVMKFNNSIDVTITNSSCEKGTGTFLELQGEKTRNISLFNNDLANAQNPVVLGKEVKPDAVIQK